MDLENLLLQVNKRRYDQKWEVNAYTRPTYDTILLKALQYDFITILTGLRRVGKTTILYLWIQDLITKHHIKSQHILYLSLDEFIVSKYNLEDIINTYKKINTIATTTHIYVFFDEITYRQTAHQELKNLFDRKIATFFVSSSSASSLIDQKAYLTGRSQTYLIKPLDFAEYCQFKGLSPQPDEYYLKEKYFEDYLRTGGMPHYIISQDDVSIKNMVNDILIKDIVAHHAIREISLLKDFFLALIERAGKQVSLTKLAHILGTSQETLRRFYGFFVDTYLIAGVSRFGNNNERLRNPKKVYLTDNGILTIFKGKREIGTAFEQAIFHLCQEYTPTYLIQDGQEIDFVLGKTLIECKYKNTMTEKQQAIFDAYTGQKYIIEGCAGYEKLKNIITSISTFS